MGLSYSAEVFYGVFVPKDSKHGRRLDKFIDEEGGTPAPVKGHPGVEIFTTGWSSTGVEWVVIAAKGSDRSFSRDDEIVAPMPLRAAEEWTARLSSALAELGIDAAADIGWHFAGSVS